MKLFDCLQFFVYTYWCLCPVKHMIFLFAFGVITPQKIYILKSQYAIKTAMIATISSCQSYHVIIACRTTLWKICVPGEKQETDDEYVIFLYHRVNFFHLYILISNLEALKFNQNILIFIWIFVSNTPPPSRKWHVLLQKNYFFLKTKKKGFLFHYIFFLIKCVLSLNSSSKYQDVCPWTVYSCFCLT